jgi:hypothetical protein
MASRAAQSKRDVHGECGEGRLPVRLAPFSFELVRYTVSLTNILPYTIQTTVAVGAGHCWGVGGSAHVSRHAECRHHSWTRWSDPARCLDRRDRMGLVARDLDAMGRRALAVSCIHRVATYPLYELLRGVGSSTVRVDQ